MKRPEETYQDKQDALLQYLERRRPGRWKVSEDTNLGGVVLSYYNTKVGFLSRSDLESGGPEWSSAKILLEMNQAKQPKKEES